MAKKIALLIGVSEYGEGISPLSSALNDVEAMERVLQNPNLGGFEQVERLLNPDAIAMRKAIHKLFKQASKDDLVLFFFSGHGITNDQAHLYLATRNTAKDDFEATAVDANFIQAQSHNCYAKRQVLILDASYSGAIAQGWRTKSVGVGVTLKTQLGAAGRVVLTSSSATQTSFGQEGLPLSLYTQYLVEGIETGAADKYGDGKIDVHELYAYAKAKVQAVKPNMTPQIILDGEGFNIILANAPKNAEAEYRKLVEQYAQNGELSTLSYRILKQKQKTFELTDEKANEIESEVLEPFRRQFANLESYKQAFIQAVGQKYPLDEHTRKILKDYQQDVLGLRDEDVAIIENRIITEQQQSETERDKLLKLEQLARTEAETELRSQQKQFEFETFKLKMEFYNSFLQTGSWQLLALQLAQRPEDVSVVLQALEQQKQSEKDNQIKILKSLLDADALEGLQLNEVNRRLLQELTEQLEKSVTALEKGNSGEILFYNIKIFALPNVISLGGELEITIDLSSDSSDEENAYFLEISRSQTIANELNIVINAPGFQLNGDNTTSLPLDPDIAQETQTARFRLTALRPGNATITAELYRGDTFETKLETQIQVADIDEAAFTPKRITTQPRPVPQPDFILRIQTIWNETNSSCKFQYQLKSFRFPSVFPENNIYTSNSLSTSWIEQVRGLLATTLENISGSLPTEGKSRLISLGQYLFEQVFPTELQTDFRSLIPQNSTFTLLILTDQEAWIPWELLYDGQRFLGDRFIIGRWLQELNDTRPYEFPVGAVNVAHYANVEQPQLWATLLEAPGAPPPQSLPAGVLHDSTEAIRGLHLIRYSQSSDADLCNAPVTLDNINHTEDIEFQMRPAKLNLRRNRPFVTLSYVKTDMPELTVLENTWASAFIRAGCSGFTGSLWAVEPAVEAAFISSFYNRLWAGASLGEAFYTSRQLARTAAPDSLDWLAYVLFGDPMARPYLPVEGKGYAVVEPIGRDIDEPIPLSVPLRFRLSLRRTPPVWHEERVMEVAEDLKFENLQVHVKTLELEITPNSIINMSLDPTGNYLGWFTLVAPPEMTANSALVQVFFMDENIPIHSLMFSLNIANQGCEPV